eukprot:5306489-Heterocapsa_arctica.AAC.1
MSWPTWTMRAVISTTVSGVVRDAAWLRRSIAILSPRLCSQSVLRSEAAADCSRRDCTELCRMAS